MLTRIRSLLNPDSSIQFAGRRMDVRIRGVRRYQITDAYHFLLSTSWLTLLLIAFGGFIVINIVFALLYLLGGDNIYGATSGSLLEAFSFSVQTFSTIGYGALTPKTPYAHVLMTVESFAGLVAVAIGTGIVYAKFSRSSARVAFSEIAVIHDRNGVPSLQFRIANERKNEMYGAHFELYMMYDEITTEGQQLSRSALLTLERDYVPLYMMTWTCMHAINETSPLFGVSADTLSERFRMLVVHFQASDSILLQTVRASHIYSPEDIRFNVRFADIIERNDETSMVLHHEKLNDTVPM